MEFSRLVKDFEITPEELIGRRLNQTEKKYAPKVLYVSGLLETPRHGPRVSIVGTRNPTENGKKNARMLASSLAKKGVVIISGLARGIDTQAHLGAIEVNGSTIAVLGTPLNKFYPPENKELQLKMMREHILVSQFPLEQPVQRKNFVLRNRTMALLCDASIIVEAGDSSGTFSQGWEALRLGRPLYIWESVFEDKHLKWPSEMVKFGAKPLSDISTLIDELPYESGILEVI